MTGPFCKPITLAAPAPAWVVRRPPASPSDADTIEVVFVGHMLRVELDRAVERLVDWPWPFGDIERERLNGGAGITILVDTHADAIGIRITSAVIPLTHVVAVVADLFDASIVCQAMMPRPNAAMHRKA